MELAKRLAAAARRTGEDAPVYSETAMYLRAEPLDGLMRYLCALWVCLDHIDEADKAPARLGYLQIIFGGDWALWPVVTVDGANTDAMRSIARCTTAALLDYPAQTDKVMLMLSQTQRGRMSGSEAVVWCSGLRTLMETHEETRAICREYVTTLEREHGL